MCGMCGVASSFLVASEIGVFRDLLFLNQLRGLDATGVIAVEKPSIKDIEKKRPLRTLWCKEANESSLFLFYDVDKKPKKMIFDGAQKRVLLGHTRAGTIGANTVQNAHPFSFSNVIGMHNGTVHKKFKHKDEYGTDSQAIYRNINDYGIDATLNEIEGYDSAYALQWIDNKTNTLNFVRNSSRPLHFATFANGSSLAWSSEDWMLKGAITRKTNQSPGAIWSPKPGFLYSYDLTAENYLSKPDVREIKIERPTYHSSYRGTHSQWGGMYGEWNEDIQDIGASKSGTTSSHTTLWPKEETKKTSVPVIQNQTTKMMEETNGKSMRTFKGFNGAYIPEGDFGRILDSGCCICGDPVNIHTPNIEYSLGWSARDQFVCPYCMERTDNAEMLGYWVKWVNKNPAEERVH